MKKMIKDSPVKAGLLGLIILMLLFSGVQTTRAALTIFSDDYYAQANMQSIGIGLVENKHYVGDEQLLDFESGRVAFSEEEFKYGKNFPEALSVVNTGTIPEYVRVILHKYWVEVDDQGNEQKLSDYDPALIELGIVNNDEWTYVSSESGEQYIFYRHEPLPTNDKLNLNEELDDKNNPAVSGCFINSIKVNGKLILIASTVETKVIDGKTVEVYTYLYDGKEFKIEAEVQGVQTHNALDAVTSAWGSDAAKILFPDSFQNAVVKEG